jgi:hypothetical protein
MTSFYLSPARPFAPLGFGWLGSGFDAGGEVTTQQIFSSYFGGIGVLMAMMYSYFGV